MALGDSVAAGVGVGRGQDTVAGRLAARLAADGGSTSWAIHARVGLTAGGVADILDRLPVVDDLREADVVVMSVGVNDLLRLRPLAVWRHDLDALLVRLTDLTQGSVVLVGMPPVGAFPALPRPVREALGFRAARIDRVGRDVAGRLGVRHVELAAHLLEEEGAFAEDGFHPSAQSHDRLAVLVAKALDRPTRGEGRAVR